MPVSSTPVDELPQVNAVTTDSLLIVVNDPDGVANTVVISTANFLANVASPVKFSNTVNVNNTIKANFLQIANTTTPMSSTPTVEKGTFWFDSNYIYVAVANNVLKRATLSSF